MPATCTPYLQALPQRRPATPPRQVHEAVQPPAAVRAPLPAQVPRAVRAVPCARAQRAPALRPCHGAAGVLEVRCTVLAVRCDSHPHLSFWARGCLQDQPAGERAVRAALGGADAPLPPHHPRAVLGRGQDQGAPHAARFRTSWAVTLTAALPSASARIGEATHLLPSRLLPGSCRSACHGCALIPASLCCLASTPAAAPAASACRAGCASSCSWVRGRCPTLQLSSRAAA